MFHTGLKAEEKCAVLGAVEGILPPEDTRLERGVHERMGIGMQVPQGGLGVADVQVVQEARVLRVLWREESVLGTDLEPGRTTAMTADIEIDRLVGRNGTAKALETRVGLATQGRHRHRAAGVTGPRPGHVVGGRNRVTVYRVP